MTAAHTNVSQDVADEYHNWRDSAPCASMNPELWFDLAEESGTSADEAKAVCRSCPLRQRCLDEAMLQQEEYGIFGGLDPNERAAYRHVWEKQNGGRGAVRARREKHGILIVDPHIDRKYTARQDAAREALSRLSKVDDFHRRDEMLQILDLIVSNPTKNAGSLAQHLGKSTTMFNTLKREALALAGVQEVYERELA